MPPATNPNTNTRPANQYRLPFEAPIFEMEARLLELEARQAGGGGDAAGLTDQIRTVRRELVGLKRAIFANLSPWETVQVSRHQLRPQSRDYLELIFDQFLELHGDRAVGDDPALVTGFAHLGEQKVMFVGHQKGRDLAERTSCNFGCAHPEGYRKALRAMRLAERHRLPIICLIDTPGAYPGIEAEERGQAAIIAENLMAMSQIDTPIVCVVIGEGGSGGALGIGIGDRVGMMEHAYYSVISPEGCATILWKTAERKDRAAEALKMTSRDLLRFEIIDEVVEEPPGGAHRDPRGAAVALKGFLTRSLRKLAEIPPDRLLDHRYQKFRRIGAFFEEPPAPIEPDPEPGIGPESGPPPAPINGTPTPS
ncbi:acetyl-CoA carboxylase carboxyltransferase subunit alpha [Tautonia plasticadhaerens]|uniref:Acetyl-coenzyme A carboxylase carboxyl transferase subunit alpha n=1 Tax=Tautonia plasticadhaerens TaxID=2527974 RepID=A0A518GVE0_9BACT|nr:acetyl-CoA carboxylase carboxyltransferase subunit alpha [Tautonia plasticadhaerens]QDV32559.1 Acetyl-coenzyme A carboxylase carboxyl transferase subunit alpha [Tautonia plasticadhaerens]